MDNKLLRINGSYNANSEVSSSKPVRITLSHQKRKKEIVEKNLEKSSLKSYVEKIMAEIKP